MDFRKINSYALYLLLLNIEYAMAMLMFVLISVNRCIMCRAEAHQLYTKKPIFDALGVQLFAVLHEHIESEVYFSTHMIMHGNWLMEAQLFHSMVPGKRLLAQILGWCRAL